MSVPTPTPPSVDAVLHRAECNDPQLSILVLALDSCDVGTTAFRERTLYIVPARELHSRALRGPNAPPLQLPLIDGRFSVVIGLRLLRSGLDATPLLREASRLIEPGGRFVLVTDSADLQSAPLPAGAMAHLAQRALRAAGMTQARFLDLGSSSIAIFEAR